MIGQSKLFYREKIIDYENSLSRLNFNVQKHWDFVPFCTLLDLNL